MLTECPVCSLRYLALNKHLKHKHAVRNLDERGIILKMASGRINVRTKPCPITGCSYAGKKLHRHVTRDHPEFSRDEAHQVMARLKHSVALQLLHDLRETNPIIGMATSLDIDNEEEYPVHPPPFSPHTECDEEDCMQVRLDNVALRAQKDALIDEVKTLRSRLKQGLKPRKQNATAALLEEDEECIRFKGVAIPSTPDMNSVASGSNTPLKTPVKTVMRSIEASASETPLKSVMRSPEASGSKTPVKTVMRSDKASGRETPLKSVMRSPEASGSKTPVKTVMWSPEASGSETPVKTVMRSIEASASEIPLKSVMRSPEASGSKTPMQTVMRSVEASCSETPVCQKTRASVSNKLKANLAKDWPSSQNQWCTGKGLRNTMREITLPKSMETYIQTYRGHCEGLAPTVKRKENCMSNVSRIKNFIVFMAHGFDRLSDWLFLKDTKRVRGWSKYISESGRTVTTSLLFLKTVNHFLRYLSASKLRGCRLTQSDMTNIIREVKANINDLKKSVTLHQFKVKRDKLDRLPSQAELLAAMAAAEKRIPDLLDLMASNPTSITQYLLYGYLTLHWSLLYGHRPGVYANMTNTEVFEADRRGTAEGYIIHVQDHKTAKTFGEAQLVLTIKEFSWVMRWMGIKEGLSGPQNEFFLFTSGKQASKNLNAHLKRAWADAGLETAVTFTILRTALADNIKHHQDPESRSILARFMCHDVSTADRFYANTPGIKEALKIRSMFRAAAAAAAASSSEGGLPPSATSEEDSGAESSDTSSSGPIGTPDEGKGAVDSTFFPRCTVQVRRLIWPPGPC